MIAIEHFSKLVVLKPLPNKEASTTASAFHAHVIGSFGAPQKYSLIKVVSGRGSLVTSWFSALSIIVLHQAEHPQSDGLAGTDGANHQKGIEEDGYSLPRPSVIGTCICLGYN
jgi:hypothetical protein